jgi:hypothetical protein
MATLEPIGSNNLLKLIAKDLNILNQNKKEIIVITDNSQATVDKELYYNTNSNILYINNNGVLEYLNSGTIFSGKASDGNVEGFLPLMWDGAKFIAIDVSIPQIGYGIVSIPQNAIFGYGYTSSNTAITNKVDNTGVVSVDTTGVGTARYALAAAGYGGDKAIFGYGYTSGVTAITNKVNNTGTVSGDTTGVGTARRLLAAAGYGGDKAIFGYGLPSSNTAMTNKVR